MMPASRNGARTDRSARSTLTGHDDPVSGKSTRE